MFDTLKDIQSYTDPDNSKLVVDYSELMMMMEEEGETLSIDNLPEVIESLSNTTNMSTVVVKDVPPNMDLREIDAKDVGMFFSTTAMIKTITEINPVVVEEVMVCSDCGKVFTMESGVSKAKCECGHPLVFDKRRTEFKDEKYLTLEEPLEMRRDGLTRSFRAHISGYEASSAYKLKAGDVCMCSGCVDVEKDKKNKNDLRFLLELNHISPISYSFDDIELEDEDIERIKELSRHENLFDELVESLAPEIFGYKDVKEGMVLQLFEGNRDFKEERSFMHILLIGEPGLAKSKLVNSVKNIAPKVITTSGTNSTKVGLTVSTNRDELTGKWSADAGAVVLGDSGVLVIDEFDKLPYDAKTSINEPMESGTVSLSKAGLTQTMTARSSILAAANPKYGRYNDEKSLIDQIDIPDSTLSRFDLIYLMKDVVDEERDRKLSMNILTNEDKQFIPPVDPKLFRNYIAYAKANYNPKMTSKSAEELSDFYVNVRQEAQGDPDSKPITARDLNAIRRLAAAHAKIHLRDEITPEDVDKALDVYTDSLDTIGLTPVTKEEISGTYSQDERDALDFAEELIMDELAETAHISNHQVLLDEIQDEYNLKTDIAAKIYNEAWEKCRREKDMG